MEKFFRECANLCVVIGDDDAADLYTKMADYYSASSLLLRTNIQMKP